MTTPRVEAIHVTPVPAPQTQPVAELRREALTVCEILLHDATPGEAATLKYVTERMLAARSARAA